MTATAPGSSRRSIDRLLHLGNVVIDLVLTVPALPDRGTDVLAAASRATPGGGYNVMAAAARQGLPVAYAGAHGSGPFAALARSGLAQAGIDVLQPPKADLDTGVVVAIVDDEGERTFVTAPGAEARLTADDLGAVPARPGDAIYLSGYGLAYDSNRPALLGWLAQLNGSNLVIFDPGPLLDQIPGPALASVMRRADWLTCNAREAAILTGEADPAAAALALAGRRPDARAGGVIVRAGPDGCLLAHDDGDPVHVPGFPVAAADTSGAGDTHTGTFIAALARGATDIEAARLANAAAAWSVTRRGPATAPTARELARFLARSAATG
ncbi:MAG TPA: PfkB family carbohydrate kinase [Streptosporangiaceae bacterium]|jgi:sugar/nucleoside kinase (ribokinase family)